MCKAFILMAALCFPAIVFAQKPALNFDACNNWPMIREPAVSNDGQYVIYALRKGDFRPAAVLVIHSTRDNREIEIPVRGHSFAMFTADSQELIFKKSADSLGVFDLPARNVTYLPGISSFKLSPDRNGKFLAYLSVTPARELAVVDRVSGKKRSFTGVSNYLFSNDGRQLLIQSQKDGAITEDLSLLNLESGRVKNFWEGKRPVNLVFDKNSREIGFIADDGDKTNPVYTIWYYLLGSAKAICAADSNAADIGPGLKINNDRLSFSQDGVRLFFNLKEKPLAKPSPESVKLDIWSYKDAELQSQQLGEPASKTFLAAVIIPEGKIVRLEQENDHLFMPFFNNFKDDFMLCSNVAGDVSQRERKWNPKSRTALYVVSAKNGIRSRVYGPGDGVFTGLSPDARFVIYYSPGQKDYLAYETASGVIRDLTHRLPVTWTTYEQNDMPDAVYMPVGIAGWTSDGADVLVYDQHDIWKLSLLGKHTPVNLTNGYGRVHHIVFRSLESRERSVFAPGQQILLTAFNQQDKNNGFYSKVLGQPGDPVKLSMGAYNYDLPRNAYFLQRARDTGVTILLRMSAATYPNVCLTMDFKTFSPVSALHPETAYNWYHTQLLNWKLADGTNNQGILYKPADFDPRKKYPVIFYYYERLSDRLNTYLYPETAGGPINIPWFVSHGYLVFTPDFHYHIGRPLQDACNTVISAAHYLSKFPWVDADRLGLQGHSWGGSETNYIVTHSHLFAAAMSACGEADAVSRYGSISHGGTSDQYFFEASQSRIGATLWERPDLFISSSPVLRADKVTTPLLLMNNKDDGQVPFAQGVEFFTALRRLGKKAWMLQYDGEGHMLASETAQRDYTIRVQQFFDHYLKGSPAPLWLLDGIPARRKGTDNGLKPDTTGRTPGPGLITNIK